MEGEKEVAGGDAVSEFYDWVGTPLQLELCGLIFQAKKK